MAGPGDPVFGDADIEKNVGSGQPTEAGAVVGDVVVGQSLLGERSFSRYRRLMSKMPGALEVPDSARDSTISTPPSSNSPLRSSVMTASEGSSAWRGAAAAKAARIQ
jgi:hypothetical protein